MISLKSLQRTVAHSTAPQRGSAREHKRHRRTAYWGLAALIALIAVPVPPSAAEGGSTAAQAAAAMPSASQEDSLPPTDARGHWLILALGFVGQGLFGVWFLVQWIASERSRAVVVPRAFWWFSVAGALLTAVYALAIYAWPILLSQIACSAIYARNLSLGSPSGLDPVLAGPAAAQSPLAGRER